MTDEWHGRGIHPDERLTPFEIELAKNKPNRGHDLDGHTGYRCRQCAEESPGTVLIESSSGDYWQTKQINWQEACDVVFRAFDDAVAAHFPDHEPVNCMTCPAKPVLPPKPQVPIDRVSKQLTRVFKKGSDQDFA